jgi:tyrosyl-tRNA synthetase
MHMEKQHGAGAARMAAGLMENVEIAVPEDGIKRALARAKKEGRPLIVKLGFDPTAPDLHLGHAVVLKKLRQFQDLGHTVTVIIGDFTARIGDPTGKNKTRPPLSQEAIKKNAATYIRQLSKVLDTKRIVTKRNGQWFSKMPFADVLRLLASYTLGKILARDDFKNRFEAGTPISLHELAYPLMQAYDSLMVKADVELGGTDQLFNLQVGRALQEANGQEPQVAVCMPLLRGTDGSDKMSKSLGNYIGLADDPRDMYGKVMAIPDSLIDEYLRLAASLSAKEQAKMRAALANGENPMEIKKAIAANIVEQYHSAKAAADAAEFFRRQFQSRDAQAAEYAEVPASSLGLGKDAALLADVLVALKAAPSKSAARRLIEQGGVLVNDAQVRDPFFSVSFGQPVRIKAGKRDFFRVI